MKEKIENLIIEYQEIANEILSDSGGAFNYDCDWDDQVETAASETEYNMYLKFIERIKEIIRE